MNFKVEIITTEDGSNTLYSPSFNEIYHSRFGAIAESRHVFITNGLKPALASNIKVFEVGLGTGLNALLSWDFAKKQHINIHYHSIELFPLTPNCALQLNYATQLEDTVNAKDVFQAIHNCIWGKTHYLDDLFSFLKEEKDLQAIQLKNDFYDVVFFDAFAPEVQAEMWSLDVFEKLFKALKPNGILVTYCSKGAVRRVMLQAGFDVIKVPGPKGKREILQAWKR